MSIRILLADDHEMLREGLRAILEREDDLEIVGEASDGRTAVAMAAKLIPDVVVMDITMPDLNGVEATRQIRTDHPEVSVVALSRHSERHYVLRILEAGAGGYVLKSAAYDELRSAVRAVTRGQKYLSPSITGIVVDERLRAAAQVEISKQADLGPREREIVQLLAEGHSSAQIAGRLHISTRTVESHRRNIMKKLGLRGVAELTRWAIREGLTSVED
jgi:DNA-binding NarL/FixJ family response regulator